MLQHAIPCRNPFAGSGEASGKKRSFWIAGGSFPNCISCVPGHCMPSYGMNTIQCALIQHLVCWVRKSSDFFWFSLNPRVKDSNRKSKSESKPCLRLSKEKHNNLWALASYPARVWAWTTSLGLELKEEARLLATCLCWFGFEIKVRTWFPLLGSWALYSEEGWG